MPFDAERRGANNGTGHAVKGGPSEGRGKLLRPEREADTLSIQEDEKSADDTRGK